MTLDQGIAAVLAAVVGGVITLGISEWGRRQQREADERRSQQEWAHQLKLNDDRTQHEDDARREQWQRDERLAAENRSRESELRRIAATRAMCLQCLDNLLEAVVHDTADVATTFSWSFSRFPDADLSLLGTPRAQVAYASHSLELLNAHGSKDLSPAVRRAYAAGTEAVMTALREQEDRLNTGEPALRCAQVKLSQVPADMLNDPGVARLWIEITRGIFADTSASE
jgi:hypothetical protein